MYPTSVLPVSVLLIGGVDGDRVVIVAQVASPLRIGFCVKAGGISDLMRSTTGHVILAHQSPEVSSRAVQLWCQPNQARPPRGFSVSCTLYRILGQAELF
jgi:DNA-binding IclR family transcriptional regulator